MGNDLEICNALGQWGSAWTCATGTCTGSDCTGSTTTGASCATAADDAGLSNCGPTSESCCTSLEVPGGTFAREYENDGSGATDLAQPATVSGYRLDKYEITVGRFRQYVAYVTSAGGAAPAAGSGKHVHLNAGNGLADTDSVHTYEEGWDVALPLPTGPSAASTWNTNLACDPTYATWTPSAGPNENRPINCLTAAEAYAFCIWDGGFLPSLAEWEYAAAGGSRQLEYPWGSAPPGAASLYSIYGCYYPGGSGTCTGVGNIAPVGTPPSGAATWGQLDLAGNVWEWTLDLDYQFTVPCVNCSAAPWGYLAADGRFIGGGGYAEGVQVSPPGSFIIAQDARNTDVGVRCARTP